MCENRHENEGQGNGVRPNGPAHPFRLVDDDLAGGVILVFCAVVVLITTTFDEVPEILSQGIPPNQFPRLMAGMISVLAIIMMIQAHTGRASRHRPVPAMAFITAGLLAFFVIAIELIGTIGAIVLFCMALPVLWGERRYRWIAAYAILFPAGVYALFSKALEVRFPVGLFRSFLG